MSATIEGREINYNLSDKNIRLLKGKLRLRQITWLSEDGKRQTLISSALQSSADIEVKEGELHVT